MQNIKDLIANTEKANRKIQTGDSIILGGIRNKHFYVGARGENNTNECMYIEDDRAIKLSELLESFQEEGRKAVKKDNDTLNTLSDLVGDKRE